MNRTSSFFRGVFVCVVGALAVACSTAPDVGSAESATQEGGTLQRRAEKGLAISPVPIDTSGMSPSERRMVGLGSYIANAGSDCGGCHVSDPARFLAGGNPFGLGPGAGEVWSRNLTPDPDTGLRMTEDEFVDVMRTGRDLHQDHSKMLVVMPWLIFRWMSDTDLRALYAYLQAVPAVHNEVPLDEKNIDVPPFIAFPGFYNDGDQDRPLPPDGSFQFQRGLAVSPEADVALPPGDRRELGLGSYIVNTMTHCEDCHTNPDRVFPSLKINTAAYLTGGAVYIVPPPLQPFLGQVRAMTANLTGAVNGFYAEPDVDYELFRNIMLTNSHFDEDPPRPLGFPMNLIATNLSNLLEEDLHAVFVYESNVPHISGEADIVTQDWARYCAADADCEEGEYCAPTSECAGRPCAVDTDCETCQTCEAGVCTEPSPTSDCVLFARS